MQRYRKILIAVTLVMIGYIFLNLFDVQAAINTDYYDKSVEGMEVVDASLNDKLSSNTLIDIIGHAIYATGCLMEWLLKAIFNVSTGTNIFPWADAVVFNAVPLLDPNFINPDSRSLLAQIGVDGGLIPKMYATIFSLSVVFFGVTVMLMALKLVTSVIAEQKAKYKQAIVQWFIGLALLYTIHFGMSFVFYLNEQLVKVASQMVDFSAAGITLAKNPNTDTAIIKNFVKDMNVNYDYIKDTINHPDIMVALIKNSNYVDFIDEYKKVLAIMGGGTEVGADYSVIIDKVIGDSDRISSTTNLTLDTTIINGYDDWTEGEFLNMSTYKSKYESAIQAVYQSTVNGGSSTNSSNLFSNLAEFFKESAWGYDENSWKADKISIQNAFMYAVFVVQSVIFFISYIKRLFYIVIFGMLAPLAVVADFIKKM